VEAAANKAFLERENMDTTCSQAKSQLSRS